MSGGMNGGAEAVGFWGSGTGRGRASTPRPVDAKGWLPWPVLSMGFNVAT